MVCNVCCHVVLAVKSRTVVEFYFPGINMCYLFHVSDMETNPANIEVDGTIRETQPSNTANEEGGEVIKKKRQKTSDVWKEFNESKLPDGTLRAVCVHCKEKLSYKIGGATSHLKRHLGSCGPRRTFNLKQRTLNFGKSNSDAQIPFLLQPSANYDLEKMREGIAHWVLMHEHPFSIVEEFVWLYMKQRRAH